MAKTQETLYYIEVYLGKDRCGSTNLFTGKSPTAYYYNVIPINQEAAKELARIDARLDLLRPQIQRERQKIEKAKKAEYDRLGRRWEALFKPISGKYKNIERLNDSVTFAERSLRGMRDEKDKSETRGFIDETKAEILKIKNEIKKLENNPELKDIRDKRSALDAFFANPKSGAGNLSDEYAKLVAQKAKIIPASKRLMLIMPTGKEEKLLLTRNKPEDYMHFDPKELPSFVTFKPREILTQELITVHHGKIEGYKEGAKRKPELMKL